MNSTGSIFNIWGLEMNQISTDLSYCVLGGWIFLPRLTHVLKEVCLLLFLTKSLSRMCTGVLKGVNLCLCCSLLPHVPSVGVLKWVSSLLFSLLTHIPFIWRSWNESQILWLGPLVGPVSTVLSVESVLPICDLKQLSFSHYWVLCSYTGVLKEGLEMNRCFRI